MKSPIRVLLIIIVTLISTGLSQTTTDYKSFEALPDGYALCQTDTTPKKYTVAALIFKDDKTGYYVIPQSFIAGKGIRGGLMPSTTITINPYSENETALSAEVIAIGNPHTSSHSIAVCKVTSINLPQPVKFASAYSAKKGMTFTVYTCNPRNQPLHFETSEVTCKQSARKKNVYLYKFSSFSDGIVVNRKNETLKFNGWFWETHILPFLSTVITDIKITPIDIQSKTTEFNIRVSFFDIRQQLKSVAAVSAPGETRPSHINSKPQGFFSPGYSEHNFNIPSRYKKKKVKVSKHSFTINGNHAEQNISLATGKAKTTIHYIQIVFRTQDNKKHYSKLIPIDLTNLEKRQTKPVIPRLFSSTEKSIPTIEVPSIQLTSAPIPNKPQLPVFEPSEIPLPGKAVECVVGKWGGKLVLHIPEKQQLAVFDTVTRTISGTIPFNDLSTLYTAGGSHIITWQKNQYQLWDIDTLKPGKTISPPQQAIPDYIHFASGVNNPLMVHSHHKQAVQGWYFLDINTGKSIKFQKAYGLHHSENNSQIIISSSGGVIHYMGRASLSQNHPPYLEKFFRITHDAEIILKPENYARLETPCPYWLTSEKLPAPSKTGERFYHGFTPYSYISAPGSNLAVHISPQDIQKTEGDLVAAFYHFDNLSQPIAAMPLPGSKGTLSTDKKNRRLPFFKQIQFIPRVNLLVIIAQNSNRILCYPVNLQELAENIGNDYLFISSIPPSTWTKGKQFIYEVNAVSNTSIASYQLVQGPEGMTINVTGTITWTPDSQLIPNTARIQVTVTAQNGLQTNQHFSLLLNRASL